MSGPISPRLLCIGGWDSSHGAGLDADREAAIATGVEVHLVSTANTEQNEGGVQELGARPAQDWLAEAAEYLPEVAVVKFGLLPGASHILAAAELIGGVGDRPWILDPLIASSSGYRFLDTRALGLLRETLLPFGPVLTPNLDEAAQLSGRRLGSGDLRSERWAMARNLLSAGANSVVLKGGHGAENPLIDLVARPGHRPDWIERPRQGAGADHQAESQGVAGGSRRGTGCRFASVLGAQLARGADLVAGATAAGDYVAQYVAAGCRHG